MTRTEAVEKIRQSRELRRTADEYKARIQENWAEIIEAGFTNDEIAKLLDAADQEGEAN